MRRIAVLDAPSNLGLRPPTPTSVPGCAKAPGALRDHGLLRRLNARDAGCLTPPRYDPGDWRPGDGVCHAPEISSYSRRLADRIGAIIDQGEFPVILGGDCSIVLGSALAMHRLGEAVGGRIGLVFVDGHSDFRHPGNASYVGAAAGEDLALVTGRGQHDLAAMEGRRPYYRDIDVVVMGIRAQDEYRLDLQAAGIVTRPVPTLRVEGAARSAQWAKEQLVDCAGYWVHVDVDVLDPAVMPAVDAPEPGGIAFPELEILLAGLVESPHCLGVEITVFDPDYDPDGAYAEEITSTIVAGLKSAQAADARPDLVAARRDLAAGNLAPGMLGPGTLARAALAAPALAASDPAAPALAASDPAASDLAASDLAASHLDASHLAMPDLGAPDLDAPDSVAPHPDAPHLIEAGSASDFGAAPDEGEKSSQDPEEDDWPDAVTSTGATAELRDAVVIEAVVIDTTVIEPDEVLSPAEDFAEAEPEEDFAPAAEPEDYFAAAETPAAATAHWPDDEFTAAEPVSAFASDGPAVLDPGEPAADLDAGVDVDLVAGEPANDPASASVSAEPDADAGFASDGTGSDLDAGLAPEEPEVDLDADLADEEPDGDLAAPSADLDTGESAANLAEAEPDDAAAAHAAAAADDAEAREPDLTTTRPLGSAPLLDSKPLPATMPGMLRPRIAEDFSLPAQRPAFEIGPEQPAER